MQIFFKQFFFVSFFFTSLINISFSQIYLNDESIYNEAEEYLAGEEYEEALPLYLILESKGYNSPNISYKIGICYFHSLVDKNKAISYLERAIQDVSDESKNDINEEKAPTKALLILGRAYHIIGNFYEALENYRKLREVSKDSTLILLSGFYEKRTQNAQVMSRFPSNTEVKAISGTSNLFLYNAFGMGDNKMLVMDKRKFYDAVVQIEIKGDTILSLHNITQNIGSDGNLFLCGGSENGKMVFFMGFDDLNGNELFFSKMNLKGEWSKVEKMPAPINSVFHEVSAFLSSDSILYFASNRNGGIGGLDIYRSNLMANGNWTEPFNLGESINTMFNETSPVVSSDNQYLYFSSEGHLNIGGYDFFYAKKTGDDYNHAYNFGTPFSTTDNDLFLTKLKSSDILYTTRIQGQKDILSSLVKFVPGDDIYRNMILVKGNLNFNDEIPPKPVNYAVLEINKNIVIHKDVTSSNGEYSFMIKDGGIEINFNYNDTINAEIEAALSENLFQTEYKLAVPQWRIISSVASKDSQDKELTVLYIKNILFEFDKKNIQPNYLSMLDSLSKVLLGDPLSKLTIAAYTDHIGSEDYNYKLSQCRAEAIANYFGSQGIAKDQLFVEGYGEKNPVAKNTFSDGRDSPDGRKYNRRAILKLDSNIKGLKIIYLDNVPISLRLN